jgi:hypothetical protein
MVILLVIPESTSISHPLFLWEASLFFFDSEVYKIHKCLKIRLGLFPCESRSHYCVGLTYIATIEKKKHVLLRNGTIEIYYSQKKNKIKKME